MLAEGGTGWNHGISMARSRHLMGPYELDPQASVMTSRDDAAIALQKAGHGELVQTQSGEWILAHLASRPLLGPASGKTNTSTPEGMHVGDRCILGRETCLQRVHWSEDGWLRLSTGGTWPQVEIPAPKELAPAIVNNSTPSEREHFDSPGLPLIWNSLRVPVDESWLSLTERPGWLRLRGRDSLHSYFYQSFIARRLQHFRVLVETCLEFEPTLYTHSAGLICYYDTRTHYYLRVSHDEKLGKVLGITLTDDSAYDELAASQIAINEWKRIYLRAEIDRARLQFSASPDGEVWQNIGGILDASKISDDYGSILHFTGAYVGLCCQDLKDHCLHADFDYFDYCIGREK
jgi:xylan 1,4-beta-xylosidase